MNIYEYEYKKSFTAAGNLAKGILKNALIQTNETKEGQTQTNEM